MEDLGAPASFLTCAEGTPIYSRDGEKLGEVEHVLADTDSDIFDGLVVDRSLLPGDDRIVPADQVEEIYERGVVLKLDAAAARDLPRREDAAGRP